MHTPWTSDRRTGSPTEASTLIESAEHNETTTSSATSSLLNVVGRLAVGSLALAAVVGLIVANQSSTTPSSSSSSLATVHEEHSGNLQDDFLELAERLAPARPSESTTQSGISLGDEYSRTLGREISDGLLRDVMPHLAQVYKPTTITPNAPGPHVWRVDGELWQSGEAMEGAIEVTFATVGVHSVEIVDLGESYTVHSKRVRRELRDLSEVDRERYFDALKVTYSTETADGKKIYGEHYRSASWYVGMHLNGAADKTCDHWHDDAGIGNHHIAYTWEYENTLTAVDPTVAAHYWDYTRDATVEADNYDGAWQHVNIFDDFWFGPAESSSNSPNGVAPGMHVVAEGRFAFLPIDKTEDHTTRITNPYGLLRSPWNTNPAPYLMRHNSVQGQMGDGYNTYPSCSLFEEFIGADWVGTMLAGIDGALHGPIHLMIGGAWGFDSSMVEYIKNTFDSPDVFLLLSKFLWRQGYIRIPEVCSSDTPVAECIPTCPQDIIRGRSVTDIFNISGIADLWSGFSELEMTSVTANVALDDVFDALCSVGYAGELFTSAAPQDPIFWAMHGNSDRFLQLARLLKKEKFLSFSEKWGYAHDEFSTVSDTGILCDWTGVTGMEMPHCYKDTCPGHREDDLLPFKYLLKDQSKEHTNAEMYDLTFPGHEDLPYVYDSLLYWEGCDEKTIFSTALRKRRSLLL